MCLAYDDVGAGACVVLLHGHPFARALWQPQLAALSEDFRVLAPDLRGFGDSPVTAGTVSMRQYAADVEALLDACDIERAALVGLSMGGLVVMELAGAAPSRYWALGLVATTAEAISPQEAETRRRRADQVEAEGMAPLIEYMHRGLYGPGTPGRLREEIDAMMAASSPQGAAAALRGRAERPDYRPVLAQLDIPAWVCAGTADPWSNQAVIAEIVAHLRQAQLVVLPQVGHLPNLEAPEAFNVALGSFLRQHAPTA